MFNKPTCSKHQLPNTLGDNFLWYIDGYMKLMQFCFAMHGAIDEYGDY